MGLMRTFLKWLVIDDQPQAQPQHQQYQYQYQEEEPAEPEVSFRRFFPDERVFTWPLFYRPSKKYVQELQTCYAQLYEYLFTKGTFGVENLQQQRDMLQNHACELERMLYRTIGEKKALEMQLQAALKWQTAAGQKNQVFVENGYEPDAKKEQPRDGKLYSNNSGRSGLENKKLAVAMETYGISRGEISRILEISPASLVTYLSEARQHCYPVDINGKQKLQFDQDYGGDAWDLEEEFKAFRFEEEACDDYNPEYLETTLPTDNMGVIDRNLKKPYIYG